jgi:hypothetical protein
VKQPCTEKHNDKTTLVKAGGGGSSNVRWQYESDLLHYNRLLRYDGRGIEYSVMYRKGEENNTHSLVKQPRTEKRNDKTTLVKAGGGGGSNVRWKYESDLLHG